MTRMSQRSFINWLIYKSWRELTGVLCIHVIVAVNKFLSHFESHLLSNFSSRRPISSLDTQPNQFIQSAKIMLFKAKCDCWGLITWSKNNLCRFFDTLVNNEICNTDLPIFLTNPVSASSASHIWQWKQSGCHDVFIALITRPITNSPHLLQHGA